MFARAVIVVAFFLCIPVQTRAESDLDQVRELFKQLHFQSMEEKDEVRQAYRVLEQYDFFNRFLAKRKEALLAGPAQEGKGRPALEPRLKAALDQHYASQGYVAETDCGEGTDSCQAYRVLEVRLEVGVWTIEVELGDLRMPGGDVTAFETLHVRPSTWSVRRG